MFQIELATLSIFIHHHIEDESCKDLVVSYRRRRLDAKDNFGESPSNTH